MTSVLARRLTRLGLAVLSGLVAALAFPTPGWWPLAFVAWVPLLVALRATSTLGGLGLGFVAGAVFFATLLRWLAPLTAGGLVALVTYLAVFVALFAAVAAALWRCRGRCLVIPAAWVGFEWVRSWLFTGFGWGAAGYALAPAPRWIQLAAIGGIPLLSFAVLATNLAVAAACTSGSRTGRCRALGVGVLIPLCMASYGTLALRDSSGQHTAAIAVLGGDIDPRDKWSERGPGISLARYVELTDRVAVDRPQLVIWPETAIPVPILDERIAILAPFLRERVEQWGIPVIVGAPTIANEAAGTYYNSAFLFRPGGVIESPYSKRHLVPFGEFVPQHPWLASFPRVVDGLSFVPGRTAPPFVIDGMRVGVLICFEDVFPDEVAVRADSVDMFAVLTNDGWFPTAGKAQHLQISIVRAVETGRSIARAANGGASALIDPRGRILDAGELLARASVPIENRRTPFSRAPDLFPKLALAVMLIALLLPGVRRVVERRHMTKRAA